MLDEVWRERMKEKEAEAETNLDSDDDSWDPIEDVIVDERGNYLDLIRHFLWMEVDSGEDEVEPTPSMQTLSIKDASTGTERDSAETIPESMPAENGKGEHMAERAATTDISTGTSEPVATTGSKKKKKKKAKSSADTAQAKVQNADAAAMTDSNKEINRPEQQGESTALVKQKPKKRRSAACKEKPETSEAPPQRDEIETKEEMRKRLEEGVKFRDVYGSVDQPNVMFASPDGKWTIPPYPKGRS